MNITISTEGLTAEQSAERIEAEYKARLKKLNQWKAKQLKKLQDPTDMTEMQATMAELAKTQESLAEMIAHALGNQPKAKPQRPRRNGKDADASMTQ